ncbi:MAG: Hpt domain-containing protein [Deltaproteobacteria bacterium]|nr:Hpt domain-containing protein [Deltaproteobacteria bacterium]
MDFRDLASRLGIDEEDFTELIELFVTTTLSDIDKIKKGVANNNPADAAAASHSIKGAAGNLGFDDIFNLAKDMEMQARKGSLDNFENFISDLEKQLDAINNL